MFLFFVINNVYFLDVFIFIFVLQFLFYFKDSSFYLLKTKFLKRLSGVFSYSNTLPLSSVISVITFLILLVSCFGGYFIYSFCPCGIIEFTLIYASVA